MNDKDLATQLAEALALNAELVEAWGKSWDCSSDPGHKIMDAVIEKHAQTIPDGFMQRVAEVVYWQLEELNAKGQMCELRARMGLAEAIKALTPEDIALLETMKGGK